MLEIFALIQDSVAQTPADVATQVGADVAAQVSALVLAGLGAVNKVVVDGAQKALAGLGKLAPSIQAIIAFAFAQGIVFLNAAVGIDLSTDVNALATSASGVLVWAASMGWHSLSQKVLKTG